MKSAGRPSCLKLTAGEGSAKKSQLNKMATPENYAGKFADPRKKAGYMALAAYVWPTLTVGQPREKAFEAVASQLGEEPENLKALVDEFYPDLEMPKPRTRDMPPLERIRHREHFKVDPVTYLRSVYRHPDEELTPTEITQRLGWEYGIHMSPTLFVLRSLPKEKDLSGKEALEMVRDEQARMRFRLPQSF